MSEKTEKKAAPTNPTPNKEGGKKRETGGAQDKFIYVGENKDHKLPPQAEQIKELIKKAGGGGITREALLAQAEKVITTKQPIGRILSYYQKRLTDHGFVKVQK
jgi:hypothetical protein